MSTMSNIIGSQNMSNSSSTSSSSSSVRGSGAPSSSSATETMASYGAVTHQDEGYVYHAEDGPYAVENSPDNRRCGGGRSSRAVFVLAALGVVGVLAFVGTNYKFQDITSANMFSFLDASYKSTIGNLDISLTTTDVDADATEETDVTETEDASTTASTSTIATSSSGDEGNDLKAIVTNEYSNRGNVMMDYPFLRDGALLMEPYRAHTVVIEGATQGCAMVWMMQSKKVMEDGTNMVMSGADEDADGTFEVTPSTHPGEYTFIVTEKCWNGGMSTSKTLVQTVWVKYVRRELMSLTDADREEFLDTFHKMWEMTTEEGIEKYGPNFKGVYYFAMVHNDAGANAVCDEYHAGAGFINNHILLGVYFERSMRMINPRVSLHYMEYTKYFSSDEFLPHMANPMDGGSWSEFLSDKWFGSNDPVTGDVLDSRWKNTIVPRVDKSFMGRETITSGATFFPDEGENWMRKTGPHISSPYGLIRAPWNYNPSPYLTRYNNLNLLATTDVSEHVLKPYMGSNCEDMKRFINDYTVGKPLETYLESAEDIVHGYIHFTFGGMGGPLAAKVDTVLRDKYQLSNTHLFYVAESAHKFVKTFLSGLDSDIVNPMNCTKNPWEAKTEYLKTQSAPGDADGPMCTCNSYYFENEENLDTLIDLYFNHFMPTDDSLKNIDFATKQEIMMLVCSRMSYEGDMGGSGAAMDPLFWVAHGSVDRLFQRVLLADVFTDRIYKNQGRGGKCSGHDADGKKKWLEGLILGDGTDASDYINTDLHLMLDPTSDQFRDLMDSVYEDSRWDWCDGFDEWLVYEQPTTGLTPLKSSNEGSTGGSGGAGGGGGSGGGAHTVKQHDGAGR